MTTDVKLQVVAISGLLGDVATLKVGPDARKGDRYVTESNALAYAEALADARVREALEQHRRGRTEHFSPFYLLSNARRIQSAPMAFRPNYVLARELFAVGRTTAIAICKEAGVDPDALQVRALTQEKT